MTKPQQDPEQSDEQVEQPDPEAPDTDATDVAADGEDVPDGTVDDVLEWVGDDPEKAQAALDAEDAQESPRTTLIQQLEARVSSA